MHTNFIMFMYCAGIEPTTSYVVGEYSHHYAKPSILRSKVIIPITKWASCVCGYLNINTTIYQCPSGYLGVFIIALSPLVFAGTQTPIFQEQFILDLRLGLPLVK
jgi:hypothetical protein